MANCGESFAYARQVGQFDSICLPFPSLLSKHTHTVRVSEKVSADEYIFFLFLLAALETHLSLSVGGVAFFSGAPIKKITHTSEFNLD
jgi:hypothetical protein